MASEQNNENRVQNDVTSPSDFGAMRQRMDPVPTLRGKLLLRLAAVSFGLLVVWGIPELLVRIADPPLEAFRAIAFGGDPASEKLFMKDWRLHWKLRPDTRTEFLNATVRTSSEGFRGEEPAPGQRVVLCLGDSTTFGWRVAQDEPFPARLQERLNRDVPAKDTWGVINAGVPGYTSLQVRLLAERLVPRWKPQVIVICVGNNEAWPVARSDRQTDADRTVTSSIAKGLSASRFLVWASEKIRPEKQQTFIAPDLNTAVPRVSRDEFRDNLREIIKIGRAANARVVLLSPPVNLYFAPQRFNQFAGWEQWQTFYKTVEDIGRSGDKIKLLETVNAAVAKNPDSFYALWIKGLVLTDLGDRDAGRELLEQAIEHHAFPENCKRSYRQIIADLARDEKTPFLDTNALFMRRATGPTPASLYLDWCHPTPQGHDYMAAALVEIMKDAGN